MTRHFFYTDGNSLMSSTRISLIAFRDEVRALKLKEPPKMDIITHGKCFLINRIGSLITNIQKYYTVNAVFSMIVPITRKEFQSIKAKARMIPVTSSIYPLGSKQQPYHENEDDYDGRAPTYMMSDVINEAKAIGMPKDGIEKLQWKWDDSIQN